MWRKYNRYAFTVQLLLNHGAVETNASELPRGTQDGGSFEEGQDEGAETATEGDKEPTEGEDKDEARSDNYPQDKNNTADVNNLNHVTAPIEDEWR
jgi:hypothetical protein